MTGGRDGVSSKSEVTIENVKQIWLGTKSANYAGNQVVFQIELHSWPKFYTVASRDGRDKYYLCLWVR